ncbi:MAG TPA: zinc ribbon domain-containing protein [Dehalococcoidia bacterium]|nr:zinc ribbon domain-containing protein [Dehalococcoidia bacterium]
MPIYEFRCNECQRTSSFFVRTVNDPLNPVCASCGSSNVERCISSFAIHKSIKTIHEESGEPTMFPKNPDYYRDPRNIGRSTEKRLKELGVDMDSEEYRDTFAGVKETIAAAREGEMPKTLKDQL